MLTSESCIETWKTSFKKENSDFSLHKSKKYPYQLGLSSLSLNVPAKVSIKKNTLLKIKLSLFDLNTRNYFGNSFDSIGIYVLKKSQKIGNVEFEGGNSPNFADGTKEEKMTLDFKNFTFYTHINTQGKEVLVILEFVIINDQKEISVGWSFFYPFDMAKGGLDVGIWGDEDREVDEGLKTIPVFNGTPRVLPLVAPLLLGAVEGFPGLSTATGSALSYRFIARPDVRNACHLWNQNSWIAPDMRIPGFQVLNSKEIIPKITEIATLSNFRIRIGPSIEEYEKRLLEKVALVHFEAFPSSFLTDEKGNLVLPTVQERRVHVGFHNSKTFVDELTLAHLVPELDEKGFGTDLVYHGQLELPSYVKQEWGMALVFMVEYKIQLTVKAPVQKKTGLSALVETFSKAPKEQPERQFVEKLVCCGWGAWGVCDSFIDRYLEVELETSATHNPFGTLIYSPKVENKSGESGEKSKGTKESQTLNVLFNFHDDTFPPASSIRGSPIMFSPTGDYKNMVDEATSPLYLSKADLTSEPAPPPLPTIKKAPVVDDEPDEQEIYENSQLTGQFAQFPSPLKGASSSSLSRIEKARLLNAGFNVLLDELGHRPVQVGSSMKNYNSIRIDFDSEKADLRFNDIHMLYMGITFNSDLFEHFGGRSPSSVFFTQQFFSFPTSTTERLHVYTGGLPPSLRQKEEAHHRTSSVPPKGKHSRTWSHMSQRSMKNYLPEETMKDEQIWPGILYSYEEDGTPNYGKAPGCELSHLVNSRLEPPSPNGNSRYGPEAIVNYMSENDVFVDIWDGDSLLHIGVCAIPLKAILRQGRDAVTIDEDIDIIWTDNTEYHDEGMTRSSSVSSHLSVANGTVSGIVSPKASTLNLGKLHIRLTNIGRSQDKVESSLTYSKDAQKLSSGFSVVLSDYHDNILHREDVLIHPHRMPEIDIELKNILEECHQERAIKRGKAAKENVAPSDKLKKLEVARKLMGKENNNENAEEGSKSSLYNLSREERSRDLHTMDIFRERKKKAVVEGFLKQQITTKQVIITSFGQAVYFEYKFTNPYNVEHNFEIVWSDHELRLVKDWSEWNYLRKIHNIQGGVESRLIGERSDGIPQIYLLPNETLSIPFVFQSFNSGLVGSQDNLLSSRRKLGEVFADGVSARKIEVSFVNSNSKPMSILELNISPRYFYIDKTMRFFCSENDYIRKTIKVPIAHSNQSRIAHDSSKPSKRYIRCSHPDVICSLSDSSKNINSLDLKFKYKTMASPNTEAIYFLLYFDPSCTILAQVWRIFIHSLQRLDVSCVMGQTNEATLIVKGGAVSRPVQCFSSQPLELVVSSLGPFILNGNSLNEIGLLLKPKSAVVQQSILNVVDAQTKILLSSWMIISRSHNPKVTKSFDILCKKGKTNSKRVSYTNPYATRKILYLKTDAEDLVTFKEPYLDLEPGASKYIGLVFLPCWGLGAEIYVFLNDEHDRSEEVLHIKVNDSEYNMINKSSAHKIEMEVVRIQLLDGELNESVVAQDVKVLIDADCCKFYYKDGSMYEANIPFLLAKYWTLPSGLLLWRKPELNEDSSSQIPFLFSWHHPLEEIKWIPLTEDKEYLKFNDKILKVQDMGRIFIISSDDFMLNLWEYKVLQIKGKNLDRNYSIHRSSPVNALKESISNALGDTRSKLGMELLMSLSMTGSIKKVFVSVSRGNLILWVLSNQELKGYKVSTREVLVNQECIDAALVYATSTEEFDVLILKSKGELVLWNHLYGLNSVSLPKEFYFSLPRKRSLEECCLEKKARVVEFKESDQVDDSVNLVFSDGTVYKATFGFEFKSSLVQRLISGIQGQIEISKECAIVKRFLGFHFSSQYDSLKEEDEFGNLVIVLFSFMDLQVQSNFGKLGKKMADIQRKIPRSILSALKVPDDVMFQSRFEKLIRSAQSLKRELQSNLLLQVDDLKAILQSFHLIYESLKLNIVLHKYLRELGEFLLRISSKIGAIKYVEYYHLDGIPKSSLPDAANILDVPFSCLKWIYTVLRNRKLIELHHVQISKSCMKELDNVIAFIKVFFKSGPPKVILEMVKREFTLNDLDSLPSGVSLFFQESLYSCKINPPGDWPREAYVLIEREDLAKLFTGCQIRTLNQNIGPEEFADIGSLYDSSQGFSKSKPKDIEELNLKEHIVSKLRFSKDNRLGRLLEYLKASKTLLYEFDLPPSSSDVETTSLQQQHLKWLSNRTLSLSFGRGLLMYQTQVAQSTEKVNIPAIFLSAKMPPLNSLVEYDVSNSDSNFKEWPDFHNGVASGLSIRENNPIIDSSWISFNQIIPTDDSISSSNSKHAGFLFGLGLNGYLKALNALDVYSYLISKDSIISIGLSLGLAASYIGSKDISIMKLLSIHIQGLLPPNAAPLNISIMTQSVSLLSLGWVFEGSLNRNLAECSLKELLTQGKDEMYTLSCGMTLGLIILGKVSQGAGLSDMQITTKLLKVVHNNDFATAVHGCTIALGLIYLKTNQVAVAEKLFVPHTMHQLDRIPPDLIVLRTISRNLIMWDEIQPSKEWIQRNLPPILRELENERKFREDMITSRQAYEAIVAGCCYSIGLRFAGTYNKQAFETLLHYYKLFEELSITGVTYASRLMSAQHKSFTDCLVVSLSMIMAGSGNLTIFSILEERHKRINSTTTYGNHMVTHMSMGLLFMGGGEFTLGTSNRAIAAMVCAFYPRFPANSDDNRFHIQAYRHLWVLAVDKRCLVTQDVESGEICPVPIIVSVPDTFNSTGVRTLELVTPCILPDPKNILHIHFKSPRYWPFSLDIENVVHKNILMDMKTIPIKRRAGHLSYIDDPEGIKGIVAMSFPRKTQDTQDERSARIRDSFIKCLSANAQFIAFAKHFAYPSTAFNDSDSFSSFCMNVLYDSLANDRPRIIRSYLWIHNILQDFKCVKNEDIWNLKIILAIYLGDVEWPNFHPCLIQQDFLENIEIRIYDYFDEIAEEDTRFVECLNHLIMTDCLDENADPLVLNQVKIYISYYDWPSSFNEVRAASLNNLDSDIFSLATKIRQNLQDIPFTTILQIASKI